MAPTKVFVGNLSFKTREPELAQEFAAAGNVVSANIISRGPRSLGYGFVELESEAAAERAVQILNRKELDGREINVEVARPRADRPEGEAAPRRGSFRGRGRGSGRGRGRGSGRGRGRGSARGGRGGQRGGDQQPAAEGEQTGETAAEPRRRRGGRGRGANAGAAGAPAGGQQQQQQQQTGGERRQRGARGGRRQADEGAREESETTLFVANLPFSITDEQLKAEFSQGGFNVKAAHVVTRVTGRSKGYGFVEYESKADQTRALAAFENKELESRQLIVKIALKDNRPAETQGQGEGQQQQGQQQQQ